MTIEQKTDKVPTIRKIAWGCGTFSDTFMANALNYLAIPIYVVALGIDPRLLGWAMGLPRLWDAISDPLMGNISDNSRSRFGRRKPFIFVGAILCGLFFALIWMPPASLNVRGMGIYFMVVAFLYYTAYTIFIVPWGAMGLGLTLDYNERTRVMAYRTFMAALFGTLLGTLWPLSLKLGEALGKDEVEGVRYIGIVFGILIVGFGIIPAIFVREKTPIQNQEKMSLRKAFVATFRNKTFVLLGIITFLIMLGLFLANPLSVFINIDYIFSGSRTSVATLNMVSNAVFHLAGLSLTPVAAWYGIKVGKKKALLTGLVFVIVGYCTSWFFFTPKCPYLQLVSFAIMAPGLSCIWVFTSSMLADICDIDELNTGLRREGMYSAVYSWFCKAGVAATLVCSGYIVVFSGYNTELEIQTASTLLKMRILYAVVPSTFISLAIILMLFYSITEEKVHEIRQKIAQRKIQDNKTV